MIKICKKPFIAEDTDRWGQGLGTYSVHNAEAGMVKQDFWEELRLFEHYGSTPEGKEELKRAQKDLSNGKKATNLSTPLMTRLLSSGGGTLWQFNMLISNDGETQEYVRSYARFNEPTLTEWSPNHEKEVKKLKAKAAEMNRRRGS